MNDRNKEILTEIRRNINELSQDKVRNKELYNKCNRVQSRIMFRTHCTEREFEIVLRKNQESYDILPEKIFTLKKWFTSWGGKLIYRDNSEWDEYKGGTGSYPSHMTLFGNAIKFSPIPPADSGYTVTIWGNQIGVVQRMDDDVEPEIPEVADEALIFGVSAMYDKEFLKDYEIQLSMLLSQIHHKTINNSKKIGW